MARRRLPTEPFVTRISRLNEDGTGHAEHAGRVLRVHGGLPGERLAARHLLGRRLRGQAQVVEVMQPARGRAEPRCPHFGTCSACAIQHMDGPTQVAFKQDRILRLLRDEGDVRPDRVLDPLVADRWHYRRKARLSVRDVPAKGRVLVGFRERDGRFVTDMQECHTLVEPIAGRLPELSALLGELDARQTIPQIEVACGDDQCALVIRHLEELSQHDVGRLRAFAEQTGLQIHLQPGGPESVCPLAATGGPLSYRLPDGVVIHFQPLDFIQVNASLNWLMIQRVREELRPGPNDDVLDLFCGLGNFTLPLARGCRSVTGVEGHPGLVSRAQSNAALNGIVNARFVAADLYEKSGLAGVADGGFARVLLDPPRGGARDLLADIADTGAARVVYVSCNPQTLAADAGGLVHRHGYRLAAAGIMDMFPQTSHVEAMAVFVKNQ